MKALTAEQMRLLEQRTLEETRVASSVLMDRAGCGVAEGVRRLALANGLEDPRILLLAGRGNNGGDAMVAARYLKQMEFEVEVLLAGRAEDLRGDAMEAFRSLKNAGVEPQILETVADWESLLYTEWIGADIAVDGLLGTGVHGPARGPAATAIQVLNRFRDRTLIVSIDIPSGLDADTGCAIGDAVMADLTLTMGLPKTGLLQPEALNFVGSLDVVDIGIPPALIYAINDHKRVELLSAHDIYGWLPPRRHQTHKGDFGHVLLVGGAPGFSGAIGLAAMAACRSGAGLVSVVTPPNQALVTAMLAPESMVHEGLTNDSGSLAAPALDLLFGDRLKTFSAALIGPGLTSHPDGLVLIEQLLHSIPVVILDADALNLLAKHPELLANQREGVILTPHPGEMARLMAMETAAVQADRHQIALHSAARFRAVTVLKGAGTVISDGQRMCVNLTGNAGMATGGMGDVLAGLITGLAAQGLEAYQAACCGVYLHGVAGDEAAHLNSQAGLTASMVVHSLPRAFRFLQAR